ncbi:hypothetical protein Micbo1qcDRAFT_171910 [Microdochium bolleyi]|uniref:Uncharacterized protein n=1 Tax=Microdochium bolleyi TaxID=196109 RepID=A0A136JEI7_9PEZI|nr:hypothetical protein Micbo1qcDRAFT_171910 [Microdochium bolleyi]
MNLQANPIDERHPATPTSPVLFEEALSSYTASQALTRAQEYPQNSMADKENSELSQGTFGDTESDQVTISADSHEANKGRKRRATTWPSLEQERLPKRRGISDNTQDITLPGPVDPLLEATRTSTTTAQAVPIAAVPEAARGSLSTQRPPTIANRRRAQNPQFLAQLHHLSRKLAPLVHVCTGRVHPDFPRTMLAYRLLTGTQLDDLAQFYHQRELSRWSRLYPRPVCWTGDLTIEGKRRKFGRFIGLRGCESPAPMPDVPSADDIAEAARLAALAAEEEEFRSASKGR